MKQLMGDTDIVKISLFMQYIFGRNYACVRAYVYVDWNTVEVD